MSASFYFYIANIFPIALFILAIHCCVLWIITTCAPNHEPLQTSSSLNACAHVGIILVIILRQLLVIKAILLVHSKIFFIIITTFIRKRSTHEHTLACAWRMSPCSCSASPWGSPQSLSLTLYPSETTVPNLPLVTFLYSLLGALASYSLFSHKHDERHPRDHSCPPSAIESKYSIENSPTIIINTILFLLKLLLFFDFSFCDGL